MRREVSVEPAWFEDLFREQGDPWNFENSSYELAKYSHTLASIPAGRPRRALEIGCANGVLTQELAERCADLIAVDVAPSALDVARKRCAHLPNVGFQLCRLPSETPSGTFDFVLLSEVAYYWDSADLKRFGEYVKDALESGGHLLLVHWLGETDYPKSGDGAVDELGSYLEGAVAIVRAERREEYRLDLWRRC